MKLISCYIEKYGIIRQKEYKFNKGITQINEGNAAGKSTLASFIKAMFYGLNSYTAKSKAFEDRQHFCPFGEKTFGGSITFDINGDIYRIERVFDQKSESKDEMRLFKNDKPTQEFGEDVGMSVFGIDKDAFVKTIFFTSSDQDLKTSSVINAKLNNFSLDDSSENTFEKGITALENASKKLKPLRGTNGVIPLLQEKINTLHSEIDNFETISRGLSDKYITRKELINKISENEKILKNARNKAVLNEKHKVYRDLCAQADGMESKINEINAIYTKGFPEESEFEKFYALEKEEASLSVKTEMLQNEEGKLREESENLKNRISMNETKLEILPENDKKDSSFLPMFIIALILVVVGVAFCVAVNLIAGILLSIVGVAFSVIGFIRLSANKNAEREKQIEWLKYNELVKQRQIENKDAYEVSMNKLNEKKQEKEMTLAELERVKCTLNNILEKYSLERDNVREAENMARRLKETTTMYKFHRTRAEKYKIDNAIEEDFVIQCSVNYDELNFEQNNLRRKLAELDRQILQDEMMAEQLELKYNELADTKEKLENGKSKLDIIEKTVKCLKEAQENLQNKYVLPVKESFCGYANQIMENVSEKVVIDGDFNVQFDEKGAYRSEKHLSTGQRSVWALCFRLALIDNMYKKEKPFVIFDDPFVHLDAKHLDKMSKIVNELAKDRQIIYFCCHDSRSLEV